MIGIDKMVSDFYVQFSKNRENHRKNDVRLFDDSECILDDECQNMFKTKILKEA